MGEIEVLLNADDGAAALPRSPPKRRALPAGNEDIGLAAQRRQLTVMFCDLVGSTELAARLDPEDMDDVTRAYHRACAEAIEAAGGYVAKYMGDGVLAYFGYPQAHEDDAERAVQAGLMLAEAVPRLPDETGAPLAVRVGVATGLVVVGDLIGEGASEERSVAGVTPNLAARLQAAAPPNGVVVSDTTRRLAAGLFDFRDLGVLSLKGLDLKEPAWQVLGGRAAANRFGARQSRGPAQMVGRDAELELVLDRWRLAAGGRGQIVGLAGEPGIGKSRLIYEVGRRIRRQPHLWLEGGGAQVFRNTPFYTIAQMVRRGLSGRRNLSPTDRLAALERALKLARVRTRHALPLIADLIGVPTPDSLAPLTLTAEQKRAGLLSALLEWLLNSAERQPTVVAVEDVHWIDPSSLELLDQLAERVSGARVLVLYSTRDAATPAWPLGPSHVRLSLGRLDAASLRSLVVAASDRELDAPTLDSVVSRAEGVPLFAEELTRLLRDQPAGARDREIPDTLSDLLMARLDRLGPAREVSQIASVLGAEFPFDLLQAVSERPTAELAAALEALVAADLLVRRGPASHGVFAFRHALIQDAAYQALLKRQRRSLHRRAATILAEDFPEVVRAQPEVQAQHWTLAGEPELAISAWDEAGRSARGRRAYHEAEHAYRQAIEVLSSLPESARRDQQELQLQGALVQLLQFLRSYGAPETAAAAARARVLAEKGGSLRQQFQQTVSVWSATSSAGDYAKAAQLADQVMRLALADGSPRLMAAAYMTQMTSRYRTGDVIGAEDAFASGRPYFAATDYHRHPGAVAHTFGTAATVAWLLGDEEEVDRRLARAMALSGQSENPFDQAFAQHVAAEIAALRSQARALETHAAESLRISEEHSFPGFTAIAHVLLGRAAAQQGEADRGVALILQGLQGRSRSAAQMTMFLTWLAEAQVLAGDAAGARATIDEALGTNPRELFFRPETLRVRGGLRIADGDAAGGEMDLREAMALAKTTGARHLHDRASADLASLISLQTTFRRGRIAIEAPSA